jgi:hypothetical protein
MVLHKVVLIMRGNHNFKLKAWPLLHPTTTKICGIFWTTIVIAFGKLAKSSRGTMNNINIDDPRS